MKINHALIAFVLMGVSSTWADGIQIEKVTGNAWYGQTDLATNGTLKAGSETGTGFVRTSEDGALYGSAGPGAKFRLGPGSVAKITGIEHGLMPCGVKNALMVTLLQGKMTTSSVPGSSGYEIRVEGGRVCLATALCVLCMHGDAAHIYVARGSALLFPLLGTFRNSGLRLMARPSIAVMSKEGTMEVEPLTQSAPGAVSCLLSGASPEIGQALSGGLPNPVNVPVNRINLRVNPPVSDIE